MQAQLAKSTSVHAVLLCMAACLQGFTFLDPQGVDANLALTAHYKMFLHAARSAPRCDRCCSCQRRLPQDGVQLGDGRLHPHDRWRLALHIC